MVPSTESHGWFLFLSERRKKLTARPVVYQTPGANRRRAANLARTTGMVGVVRDIVVPGLLPWQTGKKLKMTM